MQPHVHISPIHMLAFALFIFALFGTLHLLALTNPDNRFARLLVALGY